MSDVTYPINVMYLIDEPTHFAAGLRCGWPLNILAQAGLVRQACWEWPGPKWNDANDFPVLIKGKAMDSRDPDKPWKMPHFSDEFIRDLTAADVIVLPMVAVTGWYTQFPLWRKMGKVIVMDVDDDCFAVHPFSPTYAVRGTAEVNLRDKDGKVIPMWREEGNTADFEAMGWKPGDPQWRIVDTKRNAKLMSLVDYGLRECDGITTTTERARKRFLEFNENVYVLPNSLDTDILYQPGKHPARASGFRIGWFGGSSHESDLWCAGKGLGRFMLEHEDVTAVIMGTICQTVVKHLPSTQVEGWDWTCAEAHPWRLQGMAFDLGFCAVEPGTKFNACKSALKWTEFGALGVPAVCTNAPPYSDCVKHGEDGWLVEDTPEAWYEAFKTFYEDAALRERIGAAARSRMERDYDITNNAQMWIKCYTELVRRRKNLVVPVGV